MDTGVAMVTGRRKPRQQPVLVGTVPSLARPARTAPAHARRPSPAGKYGKLPSWLTAPIALSRLAERNPRWIR